jgi:hypothetical protein
MASYHILRSEDYDWIALYQEGKLLEQGHSIQEERLMELLGLETTHEVASQEQFDEWGGHAPTEVTNG